MEMVRILKINLRKIIMQLNEYFIRERYKIYESTYNLAMI